MSSSPRQKMVVVASPQPNELEQKKKRQTLERAKANHLSKQLQMRLQYAKLKVEHGWQRQNLNEVENLYFHHSIRHGHGHGHTNGAPQRSHHAVVTSTVANPPEMHVVGQPSSLDPNVSTDGSPLLPPPSQSPPASTANTDNTLSQPCPPPNTSLRAPVVVGLGLGVPAATAIPPSINAHLPPSASDPVDPIVLTRLAQPQTQSHPSTSISTSTSASQPVSVSVPVSLPITTPIPATSPHLQPQQTNHSHPAGIPFAYSPQSFINVPTPASVLLYPTPTSTITTSHNSTIGTSQPPLPISNTTATVSVSIPTTQVPALTYDSFWSTHASSTGPTRALYRTHAGFTASATPTGNVAMLTPGGHAAVMTAEGVYVGGGNSRAS